MEIIKNYTYTQLTQMQEHTLLYLHLKLLLAIMLAEKEGLMLPEYCSRVRRDIEYVIQERRLIP